jgi:group I intron endonuclease
MTVGIYRLVFSNTEKCYIGQSVNIEKRYLQHLVSMRNNLANYKLNEAYKVYGKPTLDILVECRLDELDGCEDESIEIFNSVDNGFNIYRFANQAPVSAKGPLSGNAKFSRNQILQVFDLLIDHPELSASQIEILTNVSTGVVSSISCGKIHTWLQEEFPDRYSKLLSQIGTRSKSNTITSDKLSAKSKGIVYPLIKSPSGSTYIVENVYRFAREHDLAGNHLTEVLNGHRKSHKGWKLCQEEQA